MSFISNQEQEDDDQEPVTHFMDPIEIKLQSGLIHPTILLLAFCYKLHCLVISFAVFIRVPLKTNF